jgi:hypothetical protein
MLARDTLRSRSSSDLLSFRMISAQAPSANVAGDDRAHSHGCGRRAGSCLKSRESRPPEWSPGWRGRKSSSPSHRSHNPALACPPSDPASGSSRPPSDVPRCWVAPQSQRFKCAEPSAAVTSGSIAADYAPITSPRVRRGGVDHSRTPRPIREPAAGTTVDGEHHPDASHRDQAAAISPSISWGARVEWADGLH